MSPKDFMPQQLFITEKPKEVECNFHYPSNYGANNLQIISHMLPKPKVNCINDWICTSQFQISYHMFIRSQNFKSLLNWITAERKPDPGYLMLKWGKVRLTAKIERVNYCITWNFRDMKILRICHIGQFWHLISSWNGPISGTKKFFMLLSSPSHLQCASASSQFNTS